eukprot:6178789-Pleurochrysis_carterae.AAC.2
MALCGPIARPCCELLPKNSRRTIKSWRLSGRVDVRWSEHVRSAPETLHRRNHQHPYASRWFGKALEVGAFGQCELM